ncbi:MAG TPA: T9SS type A sorting domain-containing protein [Bacteroidia bacterium]|jgi:hypothetical protein|nr:T9SS type A sorting domain-containing protein [Bacteroidia bacterium]
MKKIYPIILLALICFSTQQAKAQCSVLLNFADTTNGSYPQGALISDGTYLYGMTKTGGTFGLGTIFKILPNGTGYVKLLDFDGTTNGSLPYGDLYYDGSFLFGMTNTGGVFGGGTIFKIMPSGSGYSKLYDFDGMDGKWPVGSLISDGTFLYGMTPDGGLNNSGVTFKILPNGAGFTKLLDFGSSATDGAAPQGSLLYDGVSLYGMTEVGGIYSHGNIFKILPSGNGYIKLFDFNDTATGILPMASLVSDGTFLYGTTMEGGVNNTGIVFKIMSNGSGFSKIMDFNSNAVGGYPTCSLIFDGTFLYGTTSLGGLYSSGTAFKILPSGNGYSKLADFNYNTIGGGPGSLLSDGINLYGMLKGGGLKACGAVYKITNAMGVEQAAAKQPQLNIYPNPTNNQLFIDVNTTDKLNVDLYDTNGMLVLNKIMSDKNNIDISTLNEGVYTLTVKTSEGILNKKIVIIH